MKYTLEQLHLRTNDELNEIVAQAQGFIKVPSGNAIKTELYKEKLKDNTFRYLPTACTTEGKAQAFDLIIKYELEFSSKFKDEYRVYSLTDDSMYADDKNPQRATVIASIMYMQDNRG